MDIYDVVLKRSELVAEDTLALAFERPAGFEFTAGQFADFTLIDPPETDEAGDMRSFSFASAPWEEELLIVTRLRDTAYKRTLRSMGPGARVEMSGPMGEFVLPEAADRPLVFLAGGIGVTPFRSMLRQAVRDRAPRRLHLFYSNRTPESSAFLDELHGLVAEHPSLALVCTMAEMEKSAQPWAGECGFIGEALLAKHLPNLASPLYYVAGPPAMVNAMADLLVGLGVDRRAIIAEEFPGY